MGFGDKNQSSIIDDNKLTQQALHSVIVRTLIILLPLVALVVAVAALFYFNQTSTHMTVIQQRELNTVDLQKKYIITDITMISSDLLSLSQLRVLGEFIETKRTLSAGHTSDLAKDFLHFSKSRKIYDQVRLLDKNGMEIVRVNFNEGNPGIVSDDKLQNKAKRYFFSDTFVLDKGQVFMSPLDLNIEHGQIERPRMSAILSRDPVFDNIWMMAKQGEYAKPMLRFGTPVFDRQGQKCGIILLNYFGAHLLRKMDMLSNRQNSKSMLINSQGYWLKGQRPEDDWGFIYKTDKELTFEKVYPKAWQQIQSRQKGQFKTSQGLFTFSTVDLLFEGQIFSGSDDAFTFGILNLDTKEYNWKVVSHIPTETLYSARNTLLVKIGVVVGLLIILFAIGSLKLAWNITKRKQAERERKLAEEALHQSGEHLRSVLETASSAIISADVQGNIIFWNQTAVKMFGFTADEIIDKPLTTIMPERYRKSHTKGLERVVKTGKTRITDRVIELTGLRKDGSEFPLDITIAKWNTEDEIFFTGIVNNISERKMAEDALKVSEAKYRSVIDDALDSSDVGLFILDADFKIVWINHAIETYFGLERDKVIGKDKRNMILTKISDIFENPQEFIHKVISTYDDNTYVEKFECHVLSAGKRQDRWLKHRSLPIVAGLYAGGRMEHYIDITERKQVEQEHENLLRILDMKNEELKSIVYVASHDLRAPLINIKGFSDILTKHCQHIKTLVEKEDFSSDIKSEIISLFEDNISEDLSFISSSSVRMENLINGLLKVARVGTCEIEIKNIDMNRIVPEIIDTVKYQAEDVHAEITYGRLPDCKGDEDQIVQVFTNLIGNALKYLDPQQKGVIRITGQAQDGKSIYCVEDNGIGITQTCQDKIFEIYYRFDPKCSADGEGLGLTIVKRILDRHNGQIWLESEHGKSSKFFVSLPTAG